MTQTAACPDCGGPIERRTVVGRPLPVVPAGAWFRLADASRSGATTPEDAHRPSVSAPTLAEGQILGERYRVRSLLGRGGMGEVFRAFDLKLRVDVALKAVRPRLMADERALNGLRQEVRSAREMVSPNVCRVFDLVEFDGRELVSMEYVDGVTLADVLRERSPLDLPGGPRHRVAVPGRTRGDSQRRARAPRHQARERDADARRPRRRDGLRHHPRRVGIARPHGGGHRPYMAPEQARRSGGHAAPTSFPPALCWPRLVAPGGAAPRRRAKRSGEESTTSRRASTTRRGPRCSARRSHASRDQRYSTAAGLSRALDEVTLRTSRRRVAAPVSRTGRVHRARRRVLRRPRARDRSDVEEAAASASARRSLARRVPARARSCAPGSAPARRRAGA